MSNKLAAITLQLLESKLQSLTAQAKALSDEIDSVSQTLKVVRESMDEESVPQNVPDILPPEDSEVPELVNVAPQPRATHTKYKRHKQQHRSTETVDQDVNALVEFLQDGPKSSKEIAEKFGYSNIGKARWLLIKLAKDRNKIVSIRFPGRNQVKYGLPEQAAKESAA